MPGTASLSHATRSRIVARRSGLRIERQDPVAPVLDRHVQIRHDPLLARDELDHLPRDARRVHVEEPVPRDVRPVEQRAQQVREQRGAGVLAPQITTVPGRVLRHDVELPHAGRRQPLRLAHELLEGLGAMQAAHQRDRAERARVVAPFADLEIRRVRRVAGEDAERPLHERHPLRLGEVAPIAQRRNQAAQLAQPQEEVDLRDLHRQLVAVALDEASHRHHGLHFPPGLQLARVEHRLDGLLLRLLDEAARVHDDHVGSFDVRGDARTVPHERRHHALGVDRVLVAAERDERDARPRLRPRRGDLVAHGRDVRGHPGAHRIRGQRERPAGCGSLPSLRGPRHGVTTSTPDGTVNSKKPFGGVAPKSMSRKVTVRSLPFSSEIFTCLRMDVPFSIQRSAVR